MLWLALVAAPLADLEITEARAFARAVRPGRNPVVIDSVAATLAQGGPDVEGWETLHTNAEGFFTGPALNGGYVLATVTRPAAETWLLEAAGHNLVYVNGEPRGGDPYAYGYLRLPVKLRAGENRLLFQVGRGRLRARLRPVSQAAEFDLGDLTLPDLVRGQPGTHWMGLPLRNATEAQLRGLTVETELPGGRKRLTRLPTVAPLSVRKVPVEVAWSGRSTKGEVSVTLRLAGRPPQTVNLRVRDPQQTRKITFLSGIDGSVQYYALNPAARPGKRNGMVVTLHGASVEAIGQADAYAPKPDLDLVAPTNRRPYGFNWEDWGYWDALEVTDLAARTLKPDPKRVYLTGHSMGGHGTWYLGLTAPDRWAAIAPCAAWVSVFSYASAARQAETPMGELLNRAANPSDVMALVRNAAPQAVYVHHGDADATVPIGESRAMRAALQPWHPDFAMHEEPGGSHWWGSGSVDWPGIFAMFDRRRLPPLAEVNTVDFTTADPGLSDRGRWLRVVQQAVPRAFSRVQARRTPRGLDVTTTNVELLEIRSEALRNGRELRLDGQLLAGQPGLWRKGASGWAPGRLSKGEKRPEQNGPFKAAWRRRFVMVVGTTGSPQENAWAAAKARFDAEEWMYRGNGAAELVTDTDYLRGNFRGRNVILYGNRTTNSAWGRLLGDSPVQAERGRVRVGDRDLSGDLALLLVRPLPGDPQGLVAAVAATGPGGGQVVHRLPVFTAGVHFPDWFVADASMFSVGLDAVRSAGFFDNRWQVPAGAL